MADGPAQGGMAGAGEARAAWGRFSSAAKRGDVILAIGVVFILAVLILPMPTWLLDLGLAFSLTVSVLILMVSIFIEKPLQFSSFPTVLLLSTLIRLALNLASTRLILGHGHEGVEGAVRSSPPSPNSSWAAISSSASSSSSSWSSSISSSSPRARAVSPKWRRASPWTPCPASRWPSTPICPPA
ncbi:putative Flagellar biosynthesis protein FlhA [Magnetospirillum gryphiswaldense MSR-1 v2]|uniref:Flagellar biosynthesis protein FlhA n=1 Tax=Magnetospirillum gryphiswaldense (strain DSM 6361 / JCM 21280 / NBRC 15271 / MSR-1) TaxID=431944 RepID=V6F8J2_MAGGM|nr:putative Flagellar biosynthesis protein FlhA [Magnetospirillum gryphiswaldense MSR-1 v2]